MEHRETQTHTLKRGSVGRGSIAESRKKKESRSSRTRTYSGGHKTSSCL